MTHLVNNVYELREWPKKLTEVTVLKCGAGEGWKRSVGLIM
jgi:hypothetical protein